MTHFLFPSLVYQAPLTKLPRNFNIELKEEILQIKKVDKEGQAWSKKNYRSGYTSYGSLDQLTLFSSSFLTLQKTIDRHVSQFVRLLQMDINPSELQMTRCWVNVMDKGAQHSSHLHPLSVISGTYYVQTPADGSPLKFEDPKLPYYMASPPRKSKSKIENQRFFYLKPKPGQVVLFESWLKHEVPPHFSSQSRISVSFNYDWV